MSERMPAQDFVRVGTITRPHGLRGEVSVALYTAAPENMLAYRRVFLSAAEDRGSAEKREFQVLQARLADKGVLLLLSGCNSRNEAEFILPHLFSLLIICILYSSISTVSKIIVDPNQQQR